MTLPPPTGKIYWDEIVEWDIKINKMKAYTDLEQSKKLAEFLPIESADLWWAERYTGTVKENGEYIVDETPFYYRSLVPASATNYSQDTINDIPCWSLAALLELIPCADIVKLDATWTCGSILDRCEAGNPIDACYEMILKLNELNLL